MSCPTAITVLEQRINADLTQTQAVTQSNSSFQGVAVAIAIGNGSEAVASQEAEQCNKNFQIIDAIATNSAANICGGCADKSKKPEINRNQDRSESQENDYIQIGSVAMQLVDLDITQDQAVDQDNENVQLAAIAVALGGSLAKARQKSCQLNDNTQFGEATARNTVDFDSEDNKCKANSIITADSLQYAVANLTQEQNTVQANENAQLITLAVADDYKSAAIANNLNSQVNTYAEDGVVVATNTLDVETGPQILQEKQEKKQVNPANTESGEGEINKLMLSNQSFAIKVAFNHDGSIMEIAANDRGEVKVDEIKPSDVSDEADTVNTGNIVSVSLDLDGDHLAISADQNGNVFVNGEKV